MGRLLVGGRVVDDAGDCLVIAEIGHNHQGELAKAKELIRHAKECGADAVKFQKRDNRSLYAPELYHKPYEHENSFGKTYGEHREFLEFGEEQYRELDRYCKDIGIIFFATVFDFGSADFMRRLDAPAYKIASGDAKNIPLIKHVAQFGRPLFISTGGTALEDVRRIYDTVMPINTQLCLMQCTAAYPTQPEDIHLRVIETFLEQFPKATVGFSDHYNGIAMAVAAYVMGARVIEKHFTLNHTWKGTDHALSLEPIGMQKMVRDLRRLKLAMGSGRKEVLAAEVPNLIKMGKKLVAFRDLPKGHLLTDGDIAIKSPGDGMAPCLADRLVGKRLVSAVKQDQAFSEDLVSNRESAPVQASEGAAR